MKRFILAALLFIPIMGFASRFTTYSYGTDPEQQFDLWHGPENDTCILFIHGGGWKYGDKEDNGNLPLFFTANGFVTATMNYRFANGPIGYNDMADDIRDCMTQIQVLTGCTKFVFFGVSAGATMAVNYTLKRNDARVLYCVAFSGIYDMDTAYAPFLTNMVAAYCDGDYFGASPKNFAIGASAPLLLYHGHFDNVSYPYQSKTMYLAMKAVCKTANFVLLPATTHLIDNPTMIKMMECTVYYIRHIY